MSLSSDFIRLKINRGGNQTFLVPAHAADQEDVSNVRLADLCVLHGLVARIHGLLDEVANDALKLGPRHL